MAKAQKCPVCYGSGKVPNERFQQTTYDRPRKLCHGCGGLGWVTVSD